MHIRFMDLATYLSEQAITDAAFGERVGVAACTISRLRNKRMVPSFGLLARIYDATGGAVTPNDFLEVKASDRTDVERLVETVGAEFTR